MPTFALNFYSPVVADQLRTGRKTATIRLGELAWCCTGDMSEAVKYLEQSIKLDPRARLARRVLTRVYLDVHDENAAEDVMQGGSPEYARNLEGQIGSAVDDMKRRIQDDAGAVREPGTQRARRTSRP